MERKFKYLDRELEDPNPNATPEEVMRLYAGIYNDLTQGRVEGPTEKDGVQVYTLRRIAGVKGKVEDPSAEDHPVVPHGLGILQLSQCILEGALLDHIDADNIPAAPHEDLGLV